MQFLGQLRSSVRTIATSALLAIALLGMSTAAHALNPSTTFVSNSFPDFVGQAVTFSITVQGGSSPAPTGTVTVDFGDGSSPQQATLVNAAAVITHTYTSAVSVDATTTYSGDANYSPSQSVTGIVTLQLIPQGTFTSSVNPSAVGQTVTISATLTGGGGAATGTVTINFGDGSAQAVTLVNGVAAVDHSYASAGSYGLLATYPGDQTYTQHNMTFTQNVSAGLTASTTALTTSPNPASLGQSVSFTATVTGASGTPSGVVTFNFGDGSTGQATLAGGVVTTTHVYLQAGNFSATASYGGDGTFTNSTSSVVAETIGQGATSTVLTSTPNPSSVGQPALFTATVTAAPGNPTGTVTFTFGDGSTATGTVAGNVATAVHSYAASGSFSASASYGGDTNFLASTSAALTQNVGKSATTTALAASANPSNVGQPVTFTATVTGSAGPPGPPTGTVTFSFGDGTTATGTLAAGVATASHAFATAANFAVSASYGGDTVFGTSTATATQAVGKLATTTTLSSSLNPSKPGDSVTFTATVSGGSPTGIVTFKDGASVLGSVALAGAAASFTTSALTSGNHVITANYGGDAKFSASISSALTQAVGTPADSLNLRSMQDRVTPLVAQMSGQSIEGAVGSAIGEALGDNGALVTPTASGIRFNFAGEAEGQRSSSAIGSRATDPFSSAFAADTSDRSLRASSDSRVNRSFDALGLPAKAPPLPRARESRDWYGWAEVQGATLSRWGAQNALANSSALYGNQINLLAGLTRKLTPDLVVGVLGGYETFDYRSDAVQGRLKGDGWTLGSYLGWRFAPHLRFDTAIAYSGIGYDGTAGTAAGSFGGTRWLASGGVTGSYRTFGLQLEPSARIYALWEQEGAYTDTLGTLQGDRSFATGRASGGVKLSYPVAWDSGVKIAPYAGLFSDYYFNRDTSPAAASVAAPPLPLVLDGWSARATGGIAASLASGAQLEIGGERGGIGGNFAVWTYRARASIPFGAR
jgi:hypothetical protein